MVVKNVFLPFWGMKWEIYAKYFCYILNYGGLSWRKTLGEYLDRIMATSFLALSTWRNDWWTTVVIGRHGYLADMLEMNKTVLSFQGKQLTVLINKSQWQNSNFQGKIRILGNLFFPTLWSWQFFSSKDFSDEIEGGINECKFLKLYSERCQYSEDLHNSTNQYFTMTNHVTRSIQGAR